MKKKHLIAYRDEFWHQMIIESVGEETWEKINKHIRHRLLSSKNNLEFAVFMSYYPKHILTAEDLIKLKSDKPIGSIMSSQEIDITHPELDSSNPKSRYCKKSQTN
jgi:hypothetical protein